MASTPCCTAATEVEALKAKQAELIQKCKGVIDKSKTQAAALSESQSREAELAGKVAQLDAEVQRLSETISTQQQRIDELSSAELDLRIDIDSAKLEASEHAHQKQQAEQDRIAAVARLAEFESARATLEAEVAAQQAELQVARTEIAALRSCSVPSPASPPALPPLPEAAEVATLLASQSALQAENASLREAVRALEVQVQGYQGQAGDMGAQVEQARRQLGEAQEEVARLKKQMEQEKAASEGAQAALLDGLRSQVSTLQGQVSSLTTSLAGEAEGRRAAGAELEASKAAVARMKQMLLKQQSLLKAAKAADAAKDAAPSTFTVLSSLRVPGKVKEALQAHTACMWSQEEREGEGAGAEGGQAWDGLAWYLIARWDASPSTGGENGAGAQEGAAGGGAGGGSTRCRVEWVPSWRIGPQGWVGMGGVGEGGGGGTIAPTIQPLVLPSVLDACADVLSAWPSLRTAPSSSSSTARGPDGPQYPHAALSALGSIAGTGDGSPLPIGEALRRLLSVLHAHSSESSLALASAVRAGKAEVATLREELAAHKARAAAAVRAAEERVRAAQDQVAAVAALESARPPLAVHGQGVQAARLKQEQREASEEAKAAAEERAQALSDRVTSLQKRLEGAESSASSLRAAMQEQAMRFSAELGERESALAAATAALTAAQGKVHALQREQAMAQASMPAAAPAGAHSACAECRAEAEACRARVLTLEGQLRGAAAQLQAQAQAQAQADAPSDVAVPAVLHRPETPAGGLDSSTTPRGSAEGWSASEDPNPNPRHVALPSMESAGRASALLEKVLSGSAGGVGGGGGGARAQAPTPSGSGRKARQAHRSRGASTGPGEVASPGQLRLPQSRGDSSTVPWDSPAGPGLALPTVRSVGDMSRGEEDFEADLALDEGEVLTTRLVAAEGELRAMREENKRLAEQVDVLQESLAEADRAKQRAATLLGSPGPTSSSSSAPAPHTPGQGKAAVQASPTPASTPTVSLEYLKNAVVRYMASSSASERARMLPAIALLLSLSQGEVAAVAAQLEKEGASVPVTQATARNAGLFGSLFG